MTKPKTRLVVSKRKGAIALGRVNLPANFTYGGTPYATAHVVVTSSEVRLTLRGTSWDVRPVTGSRFRSNWDDYTARSVIDEILDGLTLGQLPDGIASYTPGCDVLV